MDNIRKINLDKEGLVLSKLEGSIMGTLWKRNEATAKEIFEGLRKKDVASTTIVVTLDRLHAKGLVERRVERGKGGLHYVYSPKMSKEKLGENVSLLFADRMISTFGPAMASFFSKEALERLKKAKRNK